MRAAGSAEHSESRKYARDVVLTGAATVAVRLRQVLLLPVLARLLGVASYGVWSQLAATVGLLSSVAGAFSNAGTRFIGVEDGERAAGRVVSGTIIASLASAVVLALGLVLISKPFAAQILRLPDAAALVRLAAWVTVGVTGGELAQALFRGRSRFGMYNGLTLLADCGELVAVVVAVALGYGLVGALVAFLVARVVTMVSSLALAATQIGIAAPRRSDMRKFAAYSLPLMPEQVLLWAIHVSDRYLMGHFWGNAEVGRYSAAYSLAGVVGLVAAPMMVVLFPLVARFYDRGDHARARLYLEQTARYLLLVTVPLAFVLAALSREALRLFAGDEFVAAAAFIPFVAVGLMLHRFQGLFTYVLMAAQRTRAIMWVHGIAALVNIAANAILMPRIGPIAAAYTTLGTYALGAACMWALSRSSLSITVGAGFVAKTTIASLGVAALVMFVDPRGVAACIGAGAGAAALYLGAMILMRGVTLDELRKLVALLLRRGAAA